MPKTFFIADLHLSMANHERTGLAVSFLDYVISQNANLYILGDLFDFWANNRQIILQNRPVLNKLQQLTSHNLSAGFLIGNRDFLIRPKTLSRYGVKFLGEEKEINLDGQRVYLAHGHTFCLSDTRFLRYKQKMWPRFKFLDRFLPGLLENWIAEKFILKSKKVIDSQNQSRFQITRELIENHFSQGIDVVICGHVHRGEIFRSNNHRFYTLPAWTDTTGHYLVYDKGEFSMEEYEAG